jgi:hypothetical protein
LEVVPQELNLNGALIGQEIGTHQVLDIRQDVGVSRVENMGAILVNVPVQTNTAGQASDMVLGLD